MHTLILIADCAISPILRRDRQPRRRLVYVNYLRAKVIQRRYAERREFLDAALPACLSDWRRASCTRLMMLAGVDARRWHVATTRRRACRARVGEAATNKQHAMPHHIEVYHGSYVKSHA